MKALRGNSVTTRIKRKQDGSQEVVVPDGMSPWRLGQRVWFRAVQGRIEITLTPRGRRGSGRHSRRVRRGLRSIFRDKK
jgi:hypothetical protein